MYGGRAEEIRMSMPWTVGLALTIVAAAVGCSSSSDDGDTSPAGSGPSGIPAGAEKIVVNEFVSTGSDEWLEIGNESADAFDLTGYGIADSDKDTGLAKVGKAMRFPEGTTIAGGGHVLILTGKDDMAPGPYQAGECLASSDATCFYATWGVSAADGEAVHLVAPDDTIVTTTKFPTSAAPPTGSQASECRLPDLTGEFSQCTATPGAPNEAW